MRYSCTLTTTRRVVAGIKRTRTPKLVPRYLNGTNLTFTSAADNQKYVDGFFSPSTELVRLKSGFDVEIFASGVTGGNARGIDGAPWPVSLRAQKISGIRAGRIKSGSKAVYTELAPFTVRH